MADVVEILKCTQGQNQQENELPRRARTKKWAYNFSENENKGNVTWNDVKIFKFTEEDTFTFYYKTSYSQNVFNKVNMRNKRKKMSNIREIAMTKAYSQRLVLSERKKTDLRSLIEHNLIPHYYADFYNNII